MVGIQVLGLTCKRANVGLNFGHRQHTGLHFATGCVTGILDHRVSPGCTGRCVRCQCECFICGMHYTNTYKASLLLDIIWKILMMLYMPRKPTFFSIPHNHRHFSSIHSALLMYVPPFQTEELKLGAF